MMDMSQSACGRIFKKLLLLSMAVCLMIGGNIRVRAQEPDEVTPEITLDTTGAGMVVTVKTTLAQIHVAKDNGRFLLTFSRPLAALDTDALVDQSDGKLSAIGQGHDSLLFLSDTMKLNDVRQTGRDVTATFSPIAGDTAAAAIAPGAALTPDQTKRLLTRAQISSYKGDFAEANQDYATALASAPNDPEIIGAYANSEEEAGNWRHAQDLYHQGVALDPGNQDLGESSLRVDQEHQRYAGTDIEWRDLRGFGIVLATSTNAELPIDDDWRALTQYDSDHISTGSARRLTGVELPAHQWASEESVGARYDDTDGLAASGYLYNGYTPGVGAQVSLPTDSGHFMVGGEFDRANWDYLEGLVDDGTRNRIYVEQQEAFTHRLSGELIVGYNSYNLGTERDLANGPAVAAELRYQLLQDNPSLAIVYNLDAEYSVMTTKRTNADGEQYEPFPLENREVHTVILDTDNPVSGLVNSLSKGLTDVFGEGYGLGALSGDYGQLDLFGGGGADRYGKPGPLVGGSWTKSVGAVQLQLRTSYERGLDRESTSGLIAGGYLKVRF